LRIADLRKEMELRAAAQAKSDWTATHDHLTKLPNRYAFAEISRKSEMFVETRRRIIGGGSLLLCRRENRRACEEAGRRYKRDPLHGSGDWL
ncbi:hypothetical protein ACC692_37115, partial [Rhizobium ruizarguesonis]